MRRLTAEDYAVDAVTAAKVLVGAWLCRRLEDGTVIRRRITETEAYCGEEDTACHAHKGRTARTDVMYSPGGCAYSVSYSCRATSPSPSRNTASERLSVIFCPDTREFLLDTSPSVV